MKGSLSEQLVALGISAPRRQRSYGSLSEAQLTRGTILYLPLSEDEGIVLKGGYETRKKYVVIVGVCGDELIVGSLLINSKKRRFDDPDLARFQYLLSKEAYSSFLDYSSWLDCTQIFEISQLKVLHDGSYCGTLTQEDLACVSKLLQETDTIPVVTKKRFGIL
jgi:hypothetical protein